jgi:hypothetical protein
MADLVFFANLATGSLALGPSTNAGAQAPQSFRQDGIYEADVYFVTPTFIPGAPWTYSDPSTFESLAFILGVLHGNQYLNVTSYTTSESGEYGPKATVQLNLTSIADLNSDLSAQTAIKATMQIVPTLGDGSVIPIQAAAIIYAVLNPTPPTPTVLDLNSNGVATNWTGPVNIGTNATLNDLSSVVLASASQIIGTVAQINGITGNSTTFDGGFNWQSASSGVGVTAAPACDGGYGGGGTITVNESAKLSLSGGTLQSGSGDFSSQGGSVNANLYDLGTAWSLRFESGQDESSSAGNISVSLQSAVNTISLALNFSFGSDAAMLGLSLYGGGLATINITTSGTGVGPTGNFSVDCSGSILTDSSINSVVLAWINSGIESQNLNVGGSCAAPSSGTLANISTLIGLGWTVTHN